MLLVLFCCPLTIQKTKYDPIKNNYPVTRNIKAKQENNKIKLKLNTDKKLRSGQFEILQVTSVIGRDGNFPPSLFIVSEDIIKEQSIILSLIL